MRNRAYATSLNEPCSNVLGGNFALVGSPSVGASGAIFGTLAVSTLPIKRERDQALLNFLKLVKVTWVDLFAHWKYHFRPVRKVTVHATVWRN